MGSPTNSLSPRSSQPFMEGLSLGASLPSNLAKRRSHTSEIKLHGEVLGRLEAQQKALLELVMGSATADAGPKEVETGLDYTDSWPNVEISIGINEVLRVDVQDLTFDADFVIYLDWLDPQLRRGEHYTWNAEHGKFELMRTLRSCKDDLRFFNPRISVANSKQEAEETDHLPLVFEEVFQDGRDVPWLTKKFHFVGTLACRGVDAKYFPFDIEAAQIRILSVDMEGVTSLGQDRHVCLVEPLLRKQWRHKRSKDTAWVRPFQDDEGMSHLWSTADVNDHNGLGIGEMRVIAFGGMSQLDGLEYTMHIVFRRQWYPRYMFEMMILNMQIIASASSLFVPYTDDMLANRMSITLTVMLTLVSSASGRPPAIEALPYSTLHDIYGKFALSVVALVALQSWVSFMSCWGLDRKEGINDFFDKDLWMVVNDERPVWDEWVCEYGTCGTTNMDCLALYITFAIMVVAFIFVLVRAQVHRITTLLWIKHEVDSSDHSPGKYSRLVLCSRGVSGFQLLPRFDITSAAAHVALLPGVSLFLKMWSLLRKCRQCCCCCCRPSDASQFHPIDAEELLKNVDIHHDQARKQLPQISNFNVKLSRYEHFRVLDVGSGEMGFYSYWTDEVSGAVCSSGTDSKLKYNKNQTFVDHFLHSPDGVEELAEQIIQRFGLRTMNSPLGKSASATEVEFSTLNGLQDLAGHDAVALPESPLRAAATVQVAATDPPTLPGAVGPVEGRSSSRTASVPPGAVGPVDGRSSSRTASVPPGLSEWAMRSPDSPLFRGEASLRSNRGVATMYRAGTKKKLIMCLTGANRQMLRDDVEGRTVLTAFVRGVNERIEKFGLECITYAPHDVDEAMYELWATEWVVQHGDLDVASFHLQKAYRTLQGGHEEASTTLREVEASFCDLKADEELKIAYCRASSYCRAAELPADLDPPASVPCTQFYEAFEASPPLMRALLRARLFSGTLSAGSGSSQVTLRCAGSLESSRVHSIPLGNRTPLVSMTLAAGKSSLFSGDMPHTTQLAEQLLCDATEKGRGGRRTTPAETRPAWREDGPVDPTRLELWRQLVESCAEERGLPTQCRGLFVGISALFYAAKLAGCAEEVLKRDEFLERLKARSEELIQEGGKSGRDLANLTLVYTVVKFVLHRTAFIVCKRGWRVSTRGGLDGCPPMKSDFVATWTLGMYLKHSGAMGAALGS